MGGRLRLQGEEPPEEHRLTVGADPREPVPRRRQEAVSEAAAAGGSGTGFWLLSVSRGTWCGRRPRVARPRVLGGNGKNSPVIDFR